MDQSYLCSQIATIIADYANGEFGVYDQNHVCTWANQFDLSERQIVLEETLHILQNNYITSDNFIRFANDAIDCSALHGGDSAAFWANSSILDIQIDGNSQTELNDIFCNVLHGKLAVLGRINVRSNTYLYIDDFIFSGNRLYRDIANWVELNNPLDCNVYFLTMGYYRYGEFDLNRRLQALFQGRNINFYFFSYDEFQLENRLTYKDQSERFWPTEAVRQDHTINNYLHNNGINFQFRQANIPPNKVFSPQRRDTFERIMLKYGIQIVSFSANNSAVVKPLGYDTFPNSLGFGSAVFTFRNCPNNNPLPFWWGNPQSPNPTLRRWYPLMQRRVYND